MGSRGSDYDNSGEKKSVALDWETRNESRNILSGFNSTGSYRVVSRKKNLEGMKVLGLLDSNEQDEKIITKKYYLLKDKLNQITENDLMTGSGQSGNYAHDKWKIEYEHTYIVNINGQDRPIEFYIKAYRDSNGMVMVDSIHPKMHGANTHVSWDEYNGFVF